MTSPLDGSPADRAAIVTGGSHGVGRAIVRRLGSRGYSVVVNYLHDQRAAESTVDAILADNGVAVAVRADVADDLDVERLFAETIEAFGGIDVAVHTVGAPIAATPLAGVGLDQFDALCRINTRAAFIVNREAARRLRSGGAIINLSTSVVGTTVPTYGVYAATKAATDMLTRTLASELRGHDITVNAVSLTVDEWCSPDRVADAVAYLLSDRGHCVTGQVLRVGEGRSVHDSGRYGWSWPLRRRGPYDMKS
jgi:3-oxoacyl-[acyl-carrier protein] reductase